MATWLLTLERLSWEVHQRSRVHHFGGICKNPPLLRNWWVLVTVFLLLVVNIFGEELWWRGYILPRQELSHGKVTWVVHGLLWTLFHVVFCPWVLLSYLPVCLTISFIVQRLKNTWPGIILHFAINGLVLIPITLGVLGVHGS